MRLSPFAFLLSAVALVSCGGGSSSSTVPSSGVAPRGPITFPPSTGMWSSSLGPWYAQSSGKLNAVAIDPRNSNTIFVAGGIGATDAVTTDAGVYRSNDGGSTWVAANSGLGDTTVNALAVDANGALLAATERGGIDRSTDDGQSWQQVSSVLGVRQFARSGSAWYAAGASGVYSSSDGITWTLASPTASAANAITANGSDVYAGLADGTLIRVRNGAQQILFTFPTMDSPPVVHAIALDPNNASSIYATVTGIVNGTYSDALFHSSDGGNSWSEPPLPSTLRGAQAIAFSSNAPHRLFVAGTGLAYTDDGQTFTTAGGYGDARTLLVGVQDQLFIASDQGVARGAFGQSFAPITGGIPVNIVRSVATHGSTILVTMQDFAPARSLDGGATWQTLNIGSNENGTAFINPNASNLCYIVDDGVAVSSDGCTTFSTQSIGGHLASTQPIASDPKTAQTYVLSASGAAVATDGVTFVPVQWEVPGPVDIAIDPNDGKTLYASSNVGGTRVWRSTDGARTFTPSAALVPPGPTYPNDVPVIAVDPSNSTVVIAVTETAVYRSTDRGATFTALHEVYRGTSMRAASMMHAMRDPDARADATSAGYNIGEHVTFVPTPRGMMLVLSTSTSAYASLDDGTTLSPIASNAISHVFEGFSFDGGRFCTGTDGQGVICSDPSTLASAIP